MARNEDELDVDLDKDLGGDYARDTHRGGLGDDYARDGGWSGGGRADTYTRDVHHPADNVGDQEESAQEKLRTPPDRIPPAS